MPDDLMPTKEEILAEPDPTPAPLTPTQQFTTNVLPKLSETSQISPLLYSLYDIVQKIIRTGGSELSSGFLSLLGQLPVEIHKHTGLLGNTDVEPQGYNLGTGGIGSRKPTSQSEAFKELDEMVPSLPPSQEPDLKSKANDDLTWDHFPLVSAPADAEALADRQAEQEGAET